MEEYTAIEKLKAKKKRRSRFFIIFVLIIFILIFFNESLIKPFEIYNQSPIKQFEIYLDIIFSVLLVGMIFFKFIFSEKDWKCPSCDRYLSKNANPKFCPHCGIKLQ